MSEVDKLAERMQKDIAQANSRFPSTEEFVEAVQRCAAAANDAAAGMKAFASAAGDLKMDKD